MIAAGSAEDLATNVGDRVLFDDDKAELRPEATAILDKQVAWLAMYPLNRVLIAGNADERGTEEYNLILGHGRANAVREYLIGKCIAPDRIGTISYGKNRPIAWAQNRNAITSVQ